MTEPGNFEGDKNVEFNSLLVEARNIIGNMRPFFESLIINTHSVGILIITDHPSSEDFVKIIMESASCTEIWNLAIEGIDKVEKDFEQGTETAEYAITRLHKMIHWLNEYSPRIKACSQQLNQILKQDQN